MPQILKASPLASSLARADTALATFSVDYLPSFSRTILTSSTVLGKLQSADGPVPMARGPHPAVGLSPGTLPTPAPVRVHLKPGPAILGDDKEDHDELPEVLQQLLRQHKRAAYSLFLRWERSGQREVPLEAFAEGVRSITGAPLSDHDLLAVLHCVEPLHREDISGDAQWRSRPLDCSRLWRRLQSSAARAASRYIHEVMHAPAAAPAVAPPFEKGKSFGVGTQIEKIGMPGLASDVRRLLASGAMD